MKRPKIELSLDEAVHGLNPAYMWKYVIPQIVPRNKIKDSEEIESMNQAALIEYIYVLQRELAQIHDVVPLLLDESSPDQQLKDIQKAIDSLENKIARKTGGYTRHSETREKKLLIKQAWLLMKDQYKQSNGKPDKLGFADDMYRCFDIPKDPKNIYSWIKEFEA